MLIVTVFVNLGFRLEAVWRQSIIMPFITIIIIIEADTVVCVIIFEYLGYLILLNANLA